MLPPTIRKWSNTMADIIEEIGDLIPDSDDKGDVRTVTQEYTAAEESFESDTNGEVTVTISGAISVEDIVAVLVANPNAGSDGEPDYIQVDTDLTTNSIATAEGATSTDTTDPSEDNQAVVTFYDGSAALTEATEVSVPSFKVIARGY